MARPALFLDRDGVINVDHAYVCRPEDFEFIDGIFELVAAAKRANYWVVAPTVEDEHVITHDSDSDRIENIILAIVVRCEHIRNPYFENVVLNYNYVACCISAAPLIGNNKFNNEIANRVIPVNRILNDGRTMRVTKIPMPCHDVRITQVGEHNFCSNNCRLRGGGERCHRIRINRNRWRSKRMYAAIRSCNRAHRARSASHSCARLPSGCARPEARAFR